MNNSAHMTLPTWKKHLEDRVLGRTQKQIEDKKKTNIWRVLFAKLEL